MPFRESKRGFILLGVFMLKELLVSIASGVFSALVLQILPFRARSEPRAVARRERDYAPPPPPPRRRSLFGGLMRFVLAVAGGIGLAYAAAHALHLRHFHPHAHGGGGPADGVTAHMPLLLLTVGGTFLVWLLLSALTRR